ncbi:hypothetical protein Tco_1266080 [Tanacetum coccineum]
MDARSDVYVLSNSCRNNSDNINDYYWKYTPGMFIHLSLYIDGMVFFCECNAEIWVTKALLDKANRSVLRVEIFRDQSQNTLRVSQSRFYNKKLVHTLLQRHSILSLEGSLSGDCDVEKNGNWSYAYTVGSRDIMGSITGYGFMIRGCGGSWEAKLQHIEALSTTEAGYMTLTETMKEVIRLKLLLLVH